ncbi:MAG: hypothetical protein OXE99_12110 [Cellvibrionales bacterium]|nr:hypothetical protein [Cellvibrionales bacterium]
MKNLFLICIIFSFINPPAHSITQINSDQKPIYTNIFNLKSHWPRNITAQIVEQEKLFNTVSPKGIFYMIFSNKITRNKDINNYLSKKEELKESYAYTIADALHKNNNFEKLPLLELTDKIDEILTNLLEEADKARNPDKYLIEKLGSVGIKITLTTTIKEDHNHEQDNEDTPLMKESGF